MGRPSALVCTVIRIISMLTFALALAGCIGPGGTGPTHLPRLNAPNLRYLYALSRILDADGFFRIAAVFEQHGSTEPQVLTLAGYQISRLSKVRGGDRSGWSQ
jgi:hypothetical protein